MNFSSPAGSVDSGISSFGSSSSSPSASPGSSPVYVRGSPFILHPGELFAHCIYVPSGASWRQHTLAGRPP